MRAVSKIVRLQCHDHVNGYNDITSCKWHLVQHCAPAIVCFAISLLAYTTCSAAVCQSSAVYQYDNN